MNALPQLSNTYIYLHGIAVPREILLGPRIVLAPATCPLDRDCVSAWARDNVEEGIIIIFLPTVTSQLRIDSTNDEAGAVLTWNSMWDAILLSAVEHREVAFNFQCDTPASQLSRDSNLRVMNRALRGLAHFDAHVLSEDEARWLEAHFDSGRRLMAQDSFKNAIHAMWSYRWHTIARARLALLWSGIEGLFGVESELVFRMSLYVARFLEPNAEDKRRELFAAVKKLYKARSSAVHGAEIRGDANANVDESAGLLQRLVRRCIEVGQLPHPDALVP